MVDRDRDDSEIGLLDFAILVAEHWRWFLAAPILAGLITTGFLIFSSPSKFVSEAVIRMDAVDAVKIKTEQVLKPALLQSSYLEDLNGSMPHALQQLIDRDLKVMSMGKVSAEGRAMYRLSFSYKTPDGAQELLEKIVRDFVDNSVPQGKKRENIEFRIAQLKAMISDLEPKLSQLELASSPRYASDDIQIYASNIMTSLARRYSQLGELHEELAGSVSRADVIQDATLSDAPRFVGKVMKIIAAMAAAFIATAIALLLCESFTRIHSDEKQLVKINRIRMALGLKALSQRRQQNTTNQEKAST